MKRFLFIFVLLVHLIYVHGWGVYGHRIIAQIAYDNLSKKTKKAVDELLNANGMVYYSTWADEIKSDSTIFPTSHTWHYQDLPAGLSEEVLKLTLRNYPGEGGHLWRATDSITELLRHDLQNTHCLKFIIHLVGDRFCPMHIGHLEDKGGNDLVTNWFGQKTNLHSIWDSKIIEFNKYSYSEYATILEEHFKNLKSDMLTMNREEELKQTYALTQQIYNHFHQWNGNVYHYVYKWKDSMQFQLYWAGISLARLLNDIYDPSTRK